MRTWQTQREIQNSPKSHSRLELGFSTFFLNRTTRSGILEGGVIGGKNQDGFWKLDARFNKHDLVSRIRKIARYSDRVHLYNLDAAEFIRKILPGLPKKTLVYLDPPYYAKGKDLYENHYEPQDHAAIAKIISSQIKHKWIVSYDNVSAIAELYRRHRSITYNLNYSASEKYSGAEIMIFSDELLIPDVLQPARLILKEGIIRQTTERLFTQTPASDTKHLTTSPSPMFLTK
jgi:DNA adenine methylase